MITTTQPANIGESTTLHRTRFGSVVVGKVFTNFNTRGKAFPVKTEDLQSKLFAPHKLVPILVEELLLDFDQARELIQLAVKHFETN